MKKTIYKYFFYEFLRYFATTVFTLSAIVWTIQAVNFLDLVTDDGHAFSIYFLYSFITISKVLTKLIPFCFLLATLLTILKFEKDNELIILWTSGLNKINIVNLILKISFIILLLQLLFTLLINPILLNHSRTLLKNSQLQFIPSLLKEKQFNDTVEGLTIFVDEKDKDNIYKNIFIRDDGKILSQIGTSSSIFAKSGYVTKDDKSLILLDGHIQRMADPNGNVSIIKFERTEFNLLGMTTKSISEPKIQETSTLKIIKCVQYIINDGHNCNKTKAASIANKIELNKRLGMPFYIPLMALSCCFLLASRRDKKMFQFNKYIYFFLGFSILTFAEISVRYSGLSWNNTYIYYLIPLSIIPFFYFILIRVFKYENLS